jgi:two-component system sensor histidine kinase BaeS
VLEVSDSGPGIQESEKQKIFARFYRGTSTEGRRRTPGSGVGLAVVSEIVAAHGGTINVEGGPGTGSTFTLRLPNAA